MSIAPQNSRTSIWRKARVANGLFTTLVSSVIISRLPRGITRSPTLKLKLSILCVFVLILASCQGPDTSGPGSKGSEESSVAFRVNGKAVTIKEIMSSPLVRQSLRQILIVDGIMSAAAAQGITIDEAEVDATMEEFKIQAVDRDQEFYEVMDQMDTTEADYKQNIRINMFWEALLELRLEYTDEDLKERWEENPKRYKTIYARENALTDNEKDALTFEDVRETVDEAYKYERFGALSTVMEQDIVDNTDLNITCISDPEQRKYFEDLIINKKKSSYVSPYATKVEGDDSSPSLEQDSPPDTQNEEENPGESNAETTGEEPSEAETPSEG